MGHENTKLFLPGPFVVVVVVVAFVIFVALVFVFVVSSSAVVVDVAVVVVVAKINKSNYFQGVSKNPIRTAVIASKNTF